MSAPLPQTLICTFKGKTLTYMVNVILIMSERVMAYPLLVICGVKLEMA